MKKTDADKAGAAPSEQEIQLAEKLAEMTADLQRTRADFENYRKQVDLQKEQAKELARYATVSKLLPLIDDISRAVAATPELKPLMKTLTKTLVELGLEPMDTTPGTVFDPDRHEAISMDDSEGEVEVIAETLRPGYLYEGSVLRPAMVRVGHAAAESVTTDEAATETVEKAEDGHEQDS